ncbi:hypothetical protein ECPA4_1879, partial [Escherichia coli PA4]
GSINTIPAS